MKLFEIQETYLSFIEKVESGEIPEEAVADTLAAIEGEFTDKADNIACLIKTLSAEANAIKGEADVLAERATQKKARSENLKTYLLGAMQMMDTNKIETARNRISVAKNPVKVDILDTEKLFRVHPELFVQPDPVPSKTLIKEVLESGTEVHGAALLQGYGLRIK